MGRRGAVLRVDGPCACKNCSCTATAALHGAAHALGVHPPSRVRLAQALQATEGQTEELRGHVIIAGFGRVGQIIGQLLAERLIPFVAVDVRMECVQVRLGTRICLVPFHHAPALRRQPPA